MIHYKSCEHLTKNIATFVSWLPMKQAHSQASDPRAYIAEIALPKIVYYLSDLTTGQASLTTIEQVVPCLVP